MSRIYSHSSKAVVSINKTTFCTITIYNYNTVWTYTDVPGKPHSPGPTCTPLASSHKVTQWADIHSGPARWHAYSADSKRAQSWPLKRSLPRRTKSKRYRLWRHGKTALNQRLESAAVDPAGRFRTGPAPHTQRMGSRSPGPASTPGPTQTPLTQSNGASSLPASCLSSSHFCSGCTLPGLTTSLLPAFCSLWQHIFLTLSPSPGHPGGHPSHHSCPSLQLFCSRALPQPR